MAVLMSVNSHSYKPDCCGIPDRRSPDFWRTSTDGSGLRATVRGQRSELRSTVAEWRFASLSGKLWEGFVLIFNVCSAVMFVLLQYCVEINAVDGAFEVKTVIPPHSLSPPSLASHQSVLHRAVSQMLLRQITGRNSIDYASLIDISYGITWVYIADLLIRLFIESDRYDLAVLGTVRILYVMQFIRTLTEVKHKTGDITSPIPAIINGMLDVLMHSFAVVFIAAAIFMHIENWSVERDPKLEFFECIYFIVTTLTTVGYGDIYPTSDAARAFTCALMFYLLLGMFPLITSAAEEFGKVTKYNSEPPCYNHQPVIVWQAGGQISVDRLEKLTEELFMDNTLQRVSVCVVSDTKPTSDMEVFLERERSKYLCYIEGDLMSDEIADRAGLQYAKACLLLSSPDCPEESMLTQDEEICIMGMRVRQFVADQCVRSHELDMKHVGLHPLRVVFALNKSYNAVYFMSGFYGALSTPATSNIDCSNATHTLSLREIQMQAMGKGIVCPGFAPFIANLASSRGEMVENMSKEQAKKLFSCCKDPWLKEYFSGAEHELFSIVLPFRLNEVPIMKLAACVYYETNCAMIQYDRRVHKDGQLHTVVIAANFTEANKCEEFLKTLLASSISTHPVWKEGGIQNHAHGHHDLDKLGDLDADDQHQKSVEADVQELLSPTTIQRHSFSDDTARSKAVQLSREVCKRLSQAYEEASFKESYGSIADFSNRHVVYDPSLRSQVNPLKGMEPLLQKPNSELTKNLKNHIILVAQNVAHVAHFVRVLRTVDVPPSQQKDIVIIANDQGSYDQQQILSMFSGVYIVETPQEDNGYVSVKTMIGVTLETASQVVLACCAGDSQAETAKGDYHQMCLRMVIRKINPKCVCTLEVQDYSQARFFVRGSATLNAYSKHREMSQVQTAIMSTEWVHRDDAINRAACIASGIIIEEDILEPLLVASVHQSSINDFTAALLGGSEFDFSLVCIPVPEEMIGKRYIQFFAILCAHKKIPLALYRTSKYDLQQYIYNNPDKDTMLQADDMIYVSHSHSVTECEKLTKMLKKKQNELSAVTRELSAEYDLNRKLKRLKSGLSIEDELSIRLIDPMEDPEGEEGEESTLLLA